MRTFFVSIITCLIFSSASYAVEPTGNPEVILNTPDLVAFWTFAEAPGGPRQSIGGKETHILQEVHGPIDTAETGPFSGTSIQFTGNEWLKIAHEDLGGLNICGPDAQVSMIAFIHLEQNRDTSIAGIWSEGKGANDDSGTRQYALLLDMPAYGGAQNVTPHISSEGGVTQRADGSKFPWCCDYAASPETVELHKWISVGFTYDGEYLKAFYNGVCSPRQLDPKADRRTDPYFTEDGPDGGDRSMNPYYHGRGIFCYEADKEYDPPKMPPADFIVGSRFAIGSPAHGAMKGLFGGLAVFDRALSDEQMLAIHQSANLDKLN